MQTKLAAIQARPMIVSMVLTVKIEFILSCPGMILPEVKKSLVLDKLIQATCREIRHLPQDQECKQFSQQQKQNYRSF